jgi:hypothetical protein
MVGSDASYKNVIFASFCFESVGQRWVHLADQCVRIWSAYLGRTRHPSTFGKMCDPAARPSPSGPPHSVPAMA